MFYLVMTLNYLKQKFYIQEQKNETYLNDFPRKNLSFQAAKNRDMNKNKKYIMKLE